MWLRTQTETEPTSRFTGGFGLRTLRLHPLLSSIMILYGTEASS